MASRLDNRPTAIKILDAATELFSTKGYAATTIGDVAEAVGVLKGSLYYYFDTKEDLLNQLFEKLRNQVLALVEDVQEQEDLTSVERLRYYVERHIEHNARNIHLIRVYWRELESLTGDRREADEEQRRTLNAFVEGLISNAQEDGAVHPALDVKLLTFYLFAAINYIHVWYTPGGKINPKKLAALFTELSCHGLLNAGPAANK